MEIIFFVNYEDINEIEEDKIWLGNLFASQNIDDLKRKGITKILIVMDVP